MNPVNLCSALIMSELRADKAEFLTVSLNHYNLFTKLIVVRHQIEEDGIMIGIARFFALLHRDIC